MAKILRKVSEFPVATDPTRFDIFGQDRTTGQSAKAQMSLLKGERGDSPNIFITMKTLPYGSEPTVTKGGTETEPTFEMGFPLAQNGQTPEFQYANGYIQYRYTAAEGWQNLISAEDLRLKYTNLTEAQKAELQAPAVEAANDADLAAQDARDAAQEARDAAAAAEDGKTPILEAGTTIVLGEGVPPTVEMAESGTDPESGAPIYTLNFGIPKGDRGFVPEIRGGELTASEPNSTPVLVFLQTGVTEEGVPIYSVSGTIPKGEPGSGSGNVEVDATGIIAGKQYAFVPNNDNSAMGTFQEVHIPDQQIQSDWAQEDDSAKDFIRNKPQLAPVATSGNYNDLADKPEMGEGSIVTDVTNMFSTNSPDARFFARMTQNIHAGGPVIELFGEDTSSGTNDLVITPSLGFGPDNVGSINIREYATPSATTPTDYKIITNPQSGETNGEILVPNGCPKFDLKYWVGESADYKKSRVLTGDGVWHNFSALGSGMGLNDTSANGWGGTNAVIGLYDELGRRDNINRVDVREIVFGSRYANTTYLEGNLLWSINNLEKIDLSVLKNLTRVRGLAGGRAGIYTFGKVSILDLSSWVSLEEIRSYGVEFAFSNLRNVTKLILPTVIHDNPVLYGNTTTGTVVGDGYSVGKFQALEELVIPKNSLGNKRTKIGSRFGITGFQTYTTSVGGDSALKRIDLSGWDTSGSTGNSNNGYNIFIGHSQLQEIQIGDVDVSGIGNPGADSFRHNPKDWQTGSPNPYRGECIIRADSQYLGEVFKSVYTRLEQWAVVVNS